MDCEKCKQHEEYIKGLEEHLSFLSMENRKLKGLIYSRNRRIGETYYKKVGRPSLSDRDVSCILMLRERGHSYRDISSITGFSKSVISKYCSGIGSSVHKRQDEAQDEVLALDEFVLRESSCKVENVGRVGRNSPCPCGSGRKYKHCCLR